ncbi:hypothetical protein DIPPA_09477 [Diplonema papillatum]|nr:hypothetical protein DIPPA_09477 [Diplonema papillatum]|eukprot:gene3314-5194_t
MAGPNGRAKKSAAKPVAKKRGRPPAAKGARLAAAESEPPAKRAKQADRESEPGSDGEADDASAAATLSLPDDDKSGDSPSTPPAELVTPSDTLTDVFAEALLSPAARGILSELLEKAPRIQRMRLKKAAALMRAPVRRWLVDLGRSPGEAGMGITLGSNPPRLTHYSIGAAFSISSAELTALATQARISVVKGKLGRTAVPVPQVEGDMSPKEYLDAKFVMVTGPVYVTFDNSYTSKPKTHPVLCCSIPGINYQYSDEDIQKFCKLRQKGVRKPESLTQMKYIWGHALAVMAANGVKYPVLCAIGCGEFNGGFASVPRLWARALYDVLVANPGFGFECVLVSLPTFGDDNFSVFSAEFRKAEAEAASSGAKLATPVLFVEEYSMVTLADKLAPHKSALLNPSDAEAVRKGFIGMYWDGGHIALEELLALQTTLLLQHRSLNPALWSRPADEISVNIGS